MARFKSKYADKLLQAHEPNQEAYLCREIGLTPNAESVALLDTAYAELVHAGYLVESTDQTVMVYSGGLPKNPFRLTAAGEMAGQ